MSFADENSMDQMLKTKIGAATIFSVLIDKENKINIIIDKDVLKEEYYGCSDGTTTCYLKIKTSDVIDKILGYSKHNKKIINM